ncbi:MAG: ATP-binding protein [Planctomycetes bacterium]|nr:ATP-binding protein [Planctomycetota bacterium]
MPPNEDNIRALREALRVSPENLPLRRHLAETLLTYGRADEAVTEFRAALHYAPRNSDLRLGLAGAYLRAGKRSEALVVVEDLIRSPDTPARAYVLHARLLFAAGEVEEAIRQYRRAVSEDADVADESFEEQLGISANDGETGEVFEGRVRQAPEAAPPDSTVEMERPRVSFKDVGGMEAVKEEIRIKIIHPLANPEIYRAYGKPIGGGILMYGPPGCGKTHLARATAGEVQAGFLAVGLQDVLDMWIGNSERNLHGLFERARRNRPCVLFFDEIDALGASRSDMRHSAGRHLINQFLSELDGATVSNEGVLILGATNAPWHLDPAFKRPGRFDRILFVPPPDATARAAILDILCRGKPTAGIDVEHLAKKTEGFSGADLASVVNIAVETRLREALRKGAPQPLTTKDLVDAAKAVKPSTKEWFATARNYAVYSNEGGAYDDILKYLGE